MLTKGIKRKFSEEQAVDACLDPVGSSVSLPYNLQRQSLLNISLFKLQLCKMLVEPNLCRSVLIANTVRQIQEEMIQDCSWQGQTAFTGSDLYVGHTSSDSLVATDFLCTPIKEQHVESSTASASNTSNITKSKVNCSSCENITCSAAAASVKDASTVKDLVQVHFENDLNMLESEEQQVDLKECPKPLDQVFGSFEIANYSSPLTDMTIDDLFADIDTSWHELDSVMSGLMTSPKTTPVIFELLNGLPSHTSTPINSAQNCKTDLTELDHIMEIIISERRSCGKCTGFGSDLRCRSKIYWRKWLRETTVPLTLLINLLPTVPFASRQKEVTKVPSALRFMLAKGLKRKLSDYEENMAGLPGAFDSNPGLPYTLQRQLVLNMCLIKLQSCRMLVEPNLHRSVLIANTVRQIQEEMRQEGSHEGSSSCNGPNPIPDTSIPCHGGIELTGSSVLNTSPDLNGSSDFSESQLENSLVLVSDNDMSSAISSILKDLDFMEDISPSPCPIPADESDAYVHLPFEDRTQETRPVETVFGSFEISNSTSYLTDLAFDDIFEDIDTSMYDSDLCLLPSTSVRSPPAIVDDVPKPFQLCNSTSVNTIQICRVDLSDLDHIMEILVGS
ncbi:uncharacterized protein [Hemitrygon akajei]|uniref:uncharacterized protein n=1 Tax=Hemitrygon akajei TaxID=2704970 RepID=UPI003BFA01C2